jgi:hypothetical protein
MSASLRTKDGSISVTAVIQASERASRHYVETDLDEVQAWARANNVKTRKGKPPIDSANEERVRLKLPPFRLKKTSPAKPATKADTTTVPAPAVPIARSQDELLHLVTNHSGTLTGIVTPEIAGWLLELNTGNRRLDQRSVERFRKILKRGDWMNTGEPIIVSREGVLNDGQHRLTAIKAGGLDAVADVRFGIDRDAFQATGTGKRRTAGQVLGIEGYSNTSCQAAIARLLHHYDSNQMTMYRAQVEIPAILRMIDSDDRIGQIAAKIQRSRLGVVRTGPFGFVMVVAARTAPVDRIFEFVDIVSSGLGESESDPACRLHVKLCERVNKRDRLHQIDLAALTVRAWNAWAEGRQLQHLRVADTDRTSEGFPRIREWPAEGRPRVTVAEPPAVEPLH